MKHCSTCRCAKEKVKKCIAIVPARIYSKEHRCTKTTDKDKFYCAHHRK